MRAALIVSIGALAAAWAGCGDDDGVLQDSSDRGAGVAELGGSARVEAVARTRLAQRPRGELAWVADEIRVDPGEELEHRHELAFVYGPGGGGSAVGQGAPHVHSAPADGTALWEIRLAPPGAPSPPGAASARRLFESEPLEGIPEPATASFLAVTVPPRGGRTTVHTHPGPEFIYQLSGRIDYQNEIVGTKRLAPGGAEAIPPGTAVQKRNPFKEPGVFLSWFLVDPDRPFAPKASF